MKEKLQLPWSCPGRPPRWKWWRWRWFLLLHLLPPIPTDNPVRYLGIHLLSRGAHPQPEDKTIALVIEKCFIHLRVSLAAMVTPAIPSSPSPGTQIVTVQSSQ